MTMSHTGTPEEMSSDRMQARRRDDVGTSDAPAPSRSTRVLGAHFKFGDADAPGWLEKEPEDEEPYDAEEPD